MATLAQYSARLHESTCEADSASRAPSAGVTAVGAAIYASIFLLVAIAGMLQAG